MNQLFQDVRVGLRGLRRARGFAGTTVLTLALGIGLATAVFTVANALLLRRLVIPNQERVVVIAGRTPDGGMDDLPLGLQGVRDFRERTRAVERIGWYGYEGAVPRTVSGQGEGVGVRVKRAFVGAGFFDVLGVAPVLGRAMQPEDHEVGAPPVAVLSHRTWRERYGGSADVLGRRIELHEDGHAYTIVGVMPQGLDWPRGADLWAPVLASVPEQNHATLAFHVRDDWRPMRRQRWPGVEAVSPVVAVPFSGNAAWDGRPAREDQSPEEAGANPMLNMEVVSTDYFTTVGVPVLRGRGFDERDREGAPIAVILSESAARHHWPHEDPIGRRLRLGPQRLLTVVGIVPDTRYRDLREARPSIYFVLPQSFFPFVPTTLVLRTSGPPAAVVPALRQVLVEQAPGVALASAAPFETYMRTPLAQPRLNALLLAIFAAAAVTLTAVGLFGVLTTMVRQRTSEFGIRMALGATAADVRTLVVRRGLLVALLGTAVGLALALAANRLLTSLLFEVSPTDTRTLIAIAAALLVVTAAASLLPAWAGGRIEPGIALRAET